MTSRIRCSLLALLPIVVACTEDTPIAPMAARRVGVPSATVTGAGNITVLTRNLYIGADVDLVIGALASPDPSDDIPALIAAIATLQNTAFPLRAQALADEIGRARPHVVGLQEVSEIHIDLTGLGLPVVVDQDFLALLTAALHARGLPYKLAGESTNLTAAPIPGIAVTDHDAILVDTDRVTLTAPTIAATYTPNIGVVAPGVDLKRGYVRIAAMIDGMPITIASTHLESGNAPGVSDLRAAQAFELMGVVGAASRAILLGDFNDTTGSAMHQVVTGAGFTDTWAAMRPGARGFTCCEVADLSNQIPVLNQRIDYVFARGLDGPNGNLLGQVTIIGDQPADKIAGPSFRIWPSDHAGLVASFLGVPVAP